MGPDIAEKAIDATRAATVMEHVRQNNVAYLVGTLILYQLGLLDKVVVWGAGCVA